MPRADGMGGVFLCGEVSSANGGQLVVGDVVSYWMSKRDGLTIANHRDVDTSTQELINEGLIMIGTHACPASMANQGVEGVN